MKSGGEASGVRRGLDRDALVAGLARLTRFGWPQRFPIVQFPNAALIVAFTAGQAALHVHGAGRADARGVSYLAMTIWAYEELAHGVNWFRNLLGLVYLTSTAVHLAAALGH